MHAACSPEDKATHLLVTEPRACFYIFTLYTPALCGEWRDSMTASHMDGFPPATQPFA